MRLSKITKALTATLALLMVAGAGFVVGRIGTCERTVVWLESPEGDRAAWVEEGPSLDPPAQSLWIGKPDRSAATKLGDLAEDQEWASQIFWDGEGERVGFVVRGERAAIYDAERSELLSIIALLPESADREARNVEFVAEGRELRFLECRRGSARCFGQRRIALEVAG